MKRAILAALFVLAGAGLAMGQAWTSPVDVLGAHNNQGRGCAGCHAPHSGSFGSGHGGAADAGNFALWGQDASPLYGATLAFGDGGSFVSVMPTNITGTSRDIGGILLCLSCHDGNVTPTNMMTNQSYEQAIGLLTNVAYGAKPIPTLLGNDGTTKGNYNNDHPVGQNATIRARGGLVSTNGVLTVTPGTNYAQFVANYGWPALAPGKWSAPTAINASNQAYVLCTTCHDQHVMTVYTSSAASPIAADGGGKYYAKFFFINGPYNPNITPDPTGKTAPSTTQFCRQCHFAEANEANNTLNIKTQFQ